MIDKMTRIVNNQNCIGLTFSVIFILKESLFLHTSYDANVMICASLAMFKLKEITKISYVVVVLNQALNQAIHYNGLYCTALKRIDRDELQHDFVQQDIHVGDW